MAKEYYSSVEEAVRKLYGPSVSLLSERSVSGGCINDTCILTLSNQTEVFLKRNITIGIELFKREAEGLEALTAVEGAPRVPKVLARGGNSNFSFLLLEFLGNTVKRLDNFWTIFGQELALLHRNGRSCRCGFPHDNHIGATPQRNSPMDSWVDFFREWRLEYQLKLARDGGLTDNTMMGHVGSVIRRLDTLLIEPDEQSPSLLHGDLWSGNFIDGPEGKACIIDPAVYYGHREADLAMTELFGGYNREFYEAYKNIWPLESGYAERRDLYNLYHMLNHLNLFGESYAGTVRSIASRYA